MNIKTIIFSASILLTYFYAFSGEWKVTEFQGDILTGKYPYTAYSFSDNRFKVCFYDNHSAIKLISSEMFKYEYDTRKSIIKIGFYDGGVLKHSHEAVLEIPESEGYLRHGYIVDYKPAKFLTRKQIYHWLGSKNHSIRIVADLFQMPNGFDIIVPYNLIFSNIKKNIEQEDIIKLEQEQERIKREREEERRDAEEAKREYEARIRENEMRWAKEKQDELNKINKEREPIFEEYRILTNSIESIKREIDLKKKFGHTHSERKLKIKLDRKTIILNKLIIKYPFLDNLNNQNNN